MTLSEPYSANAPPLNLMQDVQSTRLTFTLKYYVPMYSKLYATHVYSTLAVPKIATRPQGVPQHMSRTLRAHVNHLLRNDKCHILCMIHSIDLSEILLYLTKRSQSPPCGQHIPFSYNLLLQPRLHPRLSKLYLCLLLLYHRLSCLHLHRSRSSRFREADFQEVELQVRVLYERSQR